MAAAGFADGPARDEEMRVHEPRWGKKAGELVLRFAHDEFECNIQRATIDLTNKKFIRRVEGAGMMLHLRTSLGHRTDSASGRLSSPSRSSGKAALATGVPHPR